MSMLKTAVLWQVLVTNEMLAANEIDGVESSDELIEKCGKLSKTGKLSKSQKLSKSRKLKSEKTSKSRNSAKSEKKLSKSRNLINFDAIEDVLKFLTPDARTAFNRLRLAYTEAPIFWYFDPKCHDRIKTDTSGYAISGVLSQLVSETRPDRIVTKTDLSQ